MCEDFNCGRVHWIFREKGLFLHLWITLSELQMSQYESLLPVKPGMQSGYHSQDMAGPEWVHRPFVQESKLVGVLVLLGTLRATGISSEA